MKVLRHGKATEVEVADGDDVLTLTMRLASGKFESSVSIPLFASPDDKARFVESWLSLMMAGLQCTKKQG